MPERIQRKRTAGWRMPADAVNVSRPCDWSNPFKIGDTITAESDARIPTLMVTRVLAIELFRAYIAERGWVDQIRRELAGRDLVCWCPLDKPCHADVLLEIANPRPHQHPGHSIERLNMVSAIQITRGPEPPPRIIYVDRPRRHA